MYNRRLTSAEFLVRTQRESLRRRFLRQTLWGITVLPVAQWFFDSKAVHAQSPSTDPPDLRETLSAGLKARLPAEFRFVERVATMVERKQLPLTLVLSTFQWARKKARFTPYPFPYFERGLRIRAAREGIRIP